MVEVLAIKELQVLRPVGVASVSRGAESTVRKKGYRGRGLGVTSRRVRTPPSHPESVLLPFPGSSSAL